MGSIVGAEVRGTVGLGVGAGVGSRADGVRVCPIPAGCDVSNTVGTGVGTGGYVPPGTWGRGRKTQDSGKDSGVGIGADRRGQGSSSHCLLYHAPRWINVPVNAMEREDVLLLLYSPMAHFTAYLENRQLSSRPPLYYGDEV